MAGRDERVAANEASARAANGERGEWFRTHSRVVFSCECYRGACGGMLSLSREEYEHARADPARFAVLPGHVAPDVERVVERREGHWVIEKTTPDGRRVAQERDPRSRQE